MKTKVGAPSFGDDPEVVRRFAIAVPCAVIVTALFLLLSAFRSPDVHDERVVATTIVLERAPPTPRPTPRPTPVPTLAPVAHATFAPVPQRAAPHAEHTAGAAPAPVRPHVVALKHVAVVAPAAHGNGQAAGTGSGSGPGDGDAGGSGTGGNGTGSVDADAPCGVVDFIPFAAPRYDGTTAYENIQATVRFPDGHTETAEYPYPWVYPNADATDPWTPKNMRASKLPVRAQPAPYGANTSRYDDVIRYIIDHTRADGTTNLQECPHAR